MNEIVVWILICVLGAVAWILAYRYWCKEHKKRSERKEPA